MFAGSCSRLTMKVIILRLDGMWIVDAAIITIIWKVQSLKCIERTASTKVWSTIKYISTGRRKREAFRVSLKKKSVAGWHSTYDSILGVGWRAAQYYEQAGVPAECYFNCHLGGRSRSANHAFIPSNQSGCLGLVMSQDPHSSSIKLQQQDRTAHRFSVRRSCNSNKLWLFLVFFRYWNCNFAGESAIWCNVNYSD